MLTAQDRLPVKVQHSDYIGGPMELNPMLLATSARTNVGHALGLTSIERTLWTQTGRAAFRAILETVDVRGKSVLLPDYLCGDVLVPVVTACAGRPVFYRITESLMPDHDFLAEMLNSAKPAVVLLIDYFAQTDMDDTAKLIRSESFDCCIVWDAVHGLLRRAQEKTAPSWADFSFYCLHKALPVPNSAFAEGSFADAPESWRRPGDTSSLIQAIGAALLRWRFLHEAVDPEVRNALESLYLSGFADARNSAPTLPRAPAPLSLALAERCDLSVAAQRRHSNWKFLCDGLASSRLLRPLISDKSPRHAPQAFPVRVADGRRDAIRAALATQGVFCAFHWPLAVEVAPHAGPAAYMLSNELLSLPIDQRYDEEDMTSMLDRIATAESSVI